MLKLYINKLLKLVVLLSFVTVGYSQNKTGFASLAYAKTSLESIVKQYGAEIPDSSKVFKDFYLPISKQYNAAKANYEAFKGAMNDCILSNNTEKKTKQCLQRQTLNVEKNLDTLQGLFGSMFVLYYIEHPVNPKVENTTKNTGIITADFIKILIGALLDAGVKIWDEIQKKNKQFKDDYLKSIQSAQYTLGDFDVLLKQGATKK